MTTVLWTLWTAAAVYSCTYFALGLWVPLVAEALPFKITLRRPQ